MTGSSAIVTSFLSIGNSNSLIGSFLSADRVVKITKGFVHPFQR